MDTNDLIKAISADSAVTAPAVDKAWRVAAMLAGLTAALVFFAVIGPRVDIAQAAETPRFLFKFLVTAVLAASAFFSILPLSRPYALLGDRLLGLLAAPLLLGAAVLFELFAIPPSQWANRLVGSNSMICLTFIPLIGIGPLAIFLVALRRGAPTRPRLAGAVAGLLAGGVAATFYAAHCTDDSPLFVVTWYSIAVGILAVAGALLAPRVARW